MLILQMLLILSAEAHGETKGAAIVGSILNMQDMKRTSFTSEVSGTGEKDVSEESLAFQ